MAAAFYERPSSSESRGRPSSGLSSDPCAYCDAVRPGRRHRGTTLDHIQPRGRGGRDTIDNLTGCCTGCNGREGHRSLLMFLLARLEEAA